MGERHTQTKDTVCEQERNKKRDSCNELIIEIRKNMLSKMGK